MADYQVVDREQLDADMTDVADRIRAKAEISTPLAWPDGYKAAVDAIQTGVELPELTNPGDASKLLAGYQLIDSDGAVVDGNIPTVDAATPGVSVQANGDVVAYVDQAAGYTTGGYKTYKQPQDVIPAQTITPGTEDQVIPAYHYLTGKQTIKGDPNLLPENIPEDVTLFGVQGNRQMGGSAPAQEPESKDVDFYDYDGTRLYSYTLAEAQALTELPPLPSREGLVCQGWNWTLDEIKAQNTVIDVGAFYVTDDGKTRLYIKLDYPASLTVPLNINQSVSGGVVIDWGDGTAQETITGTGNVSTTHTYADTGDYVISLDVTSGTMMAGCGSAGRLFGDQGEHLAILQGIECGTGFLGFQSKALQAQAHIKTIAMSSDVTKITPDSLHDCFALCCLVVPRANVLGDYSLYNCGSLRTLCTSPALVTSPGHSCFYDCRSLRRYVMPTSGYDQISNSLMTGCFALLAFVPGNNVVNFISACFRNCKSLKEINIPSKVETIGANTFNGCSALMRMRFAPTTPPTVANSNAFTAIPTTCVVEVPAASLAEYQAATNYSGIAAQMVGV